MKEEKTAISKVRAFSGALVKTASTFSPSEKFLFGILGVVAILSALVLINRVNQLTLVEVPARGGHVSEGIIGSPRFINPLLAISDADRDLTELVYAGLLKATPKGSLVPDLALKYDISEDGLVYTFILKEDAYFHDGTPVTADDILFTIEKTQDPALKSPKRASWNGVMIEKINEKEVRFILNQPYAPFLENATLGILPKHIWQNADTEQFPFSQFNIEPVGSGPFVIERIKRNASGVPELYELKAYRKYTLGMPYIKGITVRFYSNEEALIKGFRKGDIENINSISPDVLSLLDTKRLHIKRASLPRIFAVFFNQNQASIFARQEVREALDIVIDKKRIVTEVLGGYGTDINSPIPPGILPEQTILEDGAHDRAEDSMEDRRAQARSILEAGGWEFNEDEQVWEKVVKKVLQQLRFTLATSNVFELKQAAEIIVDEWSALGVDITLQVFETGDLNQNVIRPREYDALLFGEIIGRNLDLFAFWHSSQRNDPGLNIALYANIAADKFLEDARVTSNKEEQLEKYRAFEEEVRNDIPAVFLYSPDFIYIIPKKLKGVKLGSITTPGERFLNIHEWYIETDKVWSVFK